MAIGQLDSGDGFFKQSRVRVRFSPPRHVLISLSLLPFRIWFVFPSFPSRPAAADSFANAIAVVEGIGEAEYSDTNKPIMTAISHNDGGEHKQESWEIGAIRRNTLQFGKLSPMSSLAKYILKSSDSS